MAITIKSPDAIAAKWAQRAGVAGQAYKDGVSAPRRPWAASTAAAQPAYEAGVQQAVAKGSFSSGVQKAGDQKWQTKAVNLGSQRYPTGVQAAQPAYQSGISKVVATLSSLNLPPRGAKRDPANLQRVAAVNQALAAIRGQ